MKARGGKPVVAVTMGDPAGVGPELCLRLLSEPRVLRRCVPLVFGSLAVLRRVAARTGLPVDCAEFDPAAGAAPTAPAVCDCGLPRGPVRPGQVRAACGAAALACIREAAQFVLSGRAAALVTAPVHKAALRAAGARFAGHTELLAALSGGGDPRMMFFSPRLRVALVTTHVPLADAPALITKRRVLRTIELAAAATQRAGHHRPRVAVLGLNPHAGESGLMGREEVRFIAPAVRAARKRGIRVVGPLPPDTAFRPVVRKATDVYVAMYHDQALIPFKQTEFDRGVNVTLGLPLVRTSPDHGTAFDIAWQGKASAESMIQSVLLALRLANAGR